MAKSPIIYKEKSELTAKFYHPKSRDYLNYISVIRIKSSGKFPIEMTLKFQGIPPYVGIMPPEEFSFKAESIPELFSKVVKWLKKYGYVLS